MAAKSAGIVLHRRSRGAPEIFLVHPGGPFWARKDLGAWSIPKGEFDEGEEPLAAARREFAEETGQVLEGELVPLGTFRQPSGKIVVAFALEGDFDLAAFRSNAFTLEWPPRSGRMRSFPEADRAAWFGPSDALAKVTKGQVPIIRALLDLLG